MNTNQEDTNEHISNVDVHTLWLVTVNSRLHSVERTHSGRDIPHPLLQGQEWGSHVAYSPRVEGRDRHNSGEYINICGTSVPYGYVIGVTKAAIAKFCRKLAQGWDC